MIVIYPKDAVKYELKKRKVFDRYQLLLLTPQHKIAKLLLQ